MKNLLPWQSPEAKNQLNPGDDPNTLRCGNCNSALGINPVMEDHKIKCPSCGFERSEKDVGIIPKDTCPKCGIIYKKYMEWQESHKIGSLAPPLFDFISSGPQIKPWVRFWARMIDVLLFAFLAGIVLAIIYPAALEMNDS